MTIQVRVGIVFPKAGNNRRSHGQIVDEMTIPGAGQIQLGRRRQVIQLPILHDIEVRRGTSGNRSATPDHNIDVNPVGTGRDHPVDLVCQMRKVARQNRRADDWRWGRFRHRHCHTTAGPVTVAGSSFRKRPFPNVRGRTSAQQSGTRLLTYTGRQRWASTCQSRVCDEKIDGLLWSKRT